MFAATLLCCGCDRRYAIEGTVVVARGAGAAVLPALVCEGNGGPLDSSGLYGHPAFRTDRSSTATILCKPPVDDIAFPLREQILHGALPRRAHVYAWLERVPAVEKLCAEQAKGTLEIEMHALDQLMEPEEARKDPGNRGLDSYPCGRNPAAGTPMAYAVTFDPDHRTWTDGGATWTEKRDLRIE